MLKALLVMIPIIIYTILIGLSIGIIIFPELPPLIPPQAGGRYFLYLKTIYQVNILAKRKDNIPPPHSSKTLSVAERVGVGHLFYDAFSLYSIAKSKRRLKPSSNLSAFAPMPILIEPGSPKNVPGPVMTPCLSRMAFENAMSSDTPSI